MPDTDDLQGQICSHKSFERLVIGLDAERSIYQFITAVEAIGREVADELDGFEPIEIDHLELGWLWLWWEAYHSEEKPAKLQEGIV